MRDEANDFAALQTLQDADPTAWVKAAQDVDPEAWFQAGDVTPGRWFRSVHTGEEYMRLAAVASAIIRDGWDVPEGQVLAVTRTHVMTTVAAELPVDVLKRRG